MSGSETNLRILQTLADLEELRKRAVSPDEIAKHSHLDAQEVRDYLEVLEKDGLVKLITWRGGGTYTFVTSLTGAGRVRLRELKQKASNDNQSEQASVLPIKKRRLQFLEEQQARKGNDTEPHILMEIEDLRREIGELETNQAPHSDRVGLQQITQPIQSVVSETDLLILRTIAQLADPARDTSVEDSDITEKLNLEVQEVQDSLDILEAMGLVELAKARSGYGAWLTAHGRRALRATLQTRPPSDHQAHQVHNYIITGGTQNIMSTQGGAMSVFDQRGQHVKYQYNAAGDINFGAVQNKVDVVGELEKLKAELSKAGAAQVIDAEIVEDSQHEISRAVREAKKPEPNKQAILERIDGAKKLIEGVAAAGGMVTALVKAAELVQKFF